MIHSYHGLLLKLEHDGSRRDHTRLSLHLCLLVSNLLQAALWSSVPRLLHPFVPWCTPRKGFYGNTDVLQIGHTPWSRAPHVYVWNVGDIHLIHNPASQSLTICNIYSNPLDLPVNQLMPPLPPRLFLTPFTLLILFLCTMYNDAKFVCAWPQISEKKNCFNLHLKWLY